MAIKRTNTDKGDALEYVVKVKSAKEMQSGDIALTMDVNGVVLYNCFYITRNGKNGEFNMIQFPQYKGKNGNYYNYCYFKITDEMLADIEKQIEEVLQ